VYSKIPLIFINITGADYLPTPGQINIKYPLLRPSYLPNLAINLNLLLKTGGRDMVGG